MNIRSAAERAKGACAPRYHRRLSLQQLVGLVREGLPPPHELTHFDQLRGLDLRLALERTEAKLLPHERHRLASFAAKLEECERDAGKKYVVSRLVPDPEGSRSPLVLNFSYPAGRVLTNLRAFAVPEEELGVTGIIASAPLAEEAEDPLFERFRENVARFTAEDAGAKEPDAAS